MEFKLDRDNIIDVADTISEKFREYGYVKDIDVSIKLDKGIFKKVDEDLYYRSNPDGKEFVPSDGEIIVIYNNVKVNISDADIVEQ